MQLKCLYGTSMCQYNEFSVTKTELPFFALHHLHYIEHCKSTTKYWALQPKRGWNYTTYTAISITLAWRRSRGRVGCEGLESEAISCSSSPATSSSLFANASLSLATSSYQWNNNRITQTLIIGREERAHLVICLARIQDTFFTKLCTSFYY